MGGPIREFTGEIESQIRTHETKDPARCATVSNIVNLAAVPITIDGVLLVLGDRVLVKNQTTGSQNGVYAVTTVGETTVVLTRSEDVDANTEIQSGMNLFVIQGTVNGGAEFMLSTAGTITIGTTSLTFLRVGGAATSTGWAVSNVTEDKVYDADLTTVNELADVLGTLVDVLKTANIIAA